jgi:alpha/beta superfamily hydrolase
VNAGGQDIVRSLTIKSTGASLEAALQMPSDAARHGVVVVCHPHPLYGGSMHNNVVNALCDAALQEGLAALRFNFRGVGASSGTHTGGAGEEDDVIAAIETASQEVDGRAAIGLAGYSFGASMAASALSRCEESVQALVLISPPMGRLALALLGDDARAGLYATQSDRHGPPLLLATGDNDSVCPARDLEGLATQLEPRPTYVLIEGADHFWTGHEDALRDTAGSFLRWNLAGR